MLWREKCGKKPGKTTLYKAIAWLDSRTMLTIPREEYPGEETVIRERLSGRRSVDHWRGKISVRMTTEKLMALTRGIV
jgi:hypothetical protein